MNTAESKVFDLLGKEAEDLLNHSCQISKDRLHAPGPDFVNRVLSATDRPISVLRNFQTMLNHGRLGGTGYLSILPVDQGIEHSAGVSFAPNLDYFDPEKIVELAYEGGCNAVASTLGVLGACSRKWAHKIPFLMKINHNELMTYPNVFDQRLFGSVQQAFEMGAVAVGATIYFGSEQSTRQIEEISAAFEQAHSLGLVTVLWCYTRNEAFNQKKQGGKDHHTAADLTGQANHLGVTIQADIIKQKLPTHTGGYAALNTGDSSYGKFDSHIYTDLQGANQDGSGGHLIDLTRYQVMNCYMGRSPLLNSGGASSGAGDLGEAVKTAIINKRAGGIGLISGRKAFQKSFKDGVELLNMVQNVYLDESITLA